MRTQVELSKIKWQCLQDFQILWNIHGSFQHLLFYDSAFPQTPVACVSDSQYLQGQELARFRITSLQSSAKSKPRFFKVSYIITNDSANRHNSRL